jgi:hypothetical protein
MPSLPSWAAAWAQATASAEPAIALLTLYHPEMANVYIARNPQDIVSRGNTFVAGWFEPNIVADGASPPRAQISMPNINRTLGILLQRLVGPMQATIEVVTPTHLEEPVYRAARLWVRGIAVDPTTITGDLSRQDHDAETCGLIRVTPARFPAIFRK